MSRSTTFDELYTTLGQVVTRATGRPYWRKGGIQARPDRTHATVYITQGQGFVPEIIELVELAGTTPGETLQQVAWGTMRLQAEVEFIRSGPNDSALQAATRFKNSLQLDARWSDLWEIAGLIGPVDLMDISAIFRADSEPRTRITFHFYANVTELPLNDTNISDIIGQPLVINLDEPQSEIINVTVMKYPVEFNGSVATLGGEPVTFGQA